MPTTGEAKHASHGAVLVAAFTVGLSGALMPGPVTVVAIDHAARGSWLAGTLTAVGHGLVEIVMVLVILLGLARLMRHPAAAGTVALLGGLVLIWMGWDMVVSAPAAALPAAAPGAEGSLRTLGGSLAAGAVATLSNPYWFLWWVTVGTSQLAWSQEQVRGGLWVFTAGHISSDIIWLSLLSAAAATGRRFLTDQTYQGMLYLMGAVIVIIGAYFIYTARKLYLGEGPQIPFAARQPAATCPPPECAHRTDDT